MLVKAKRHSQLSFSHLSLSPFYLSYHRDFLPPLTYFQTSLLPSMLPSPLRCCLYPSHLFHLSSIFQTPQFSLLQVASSQHLSRLSLWFLLPFSRLNNPTSSKHIRLFFCVAALAHPSEILERCPYSGSILHLYSNPPSIILTQPFNRHNKEFNHLSCYLNTCR